MITDSATDSLLMEFSRYPPRTMMLTAATARKNWDRLIILSPSSSKCARHNRLLVGILTLTVAPLRRPGSVLILAFQDVVLCRYSLTSFSRRDRDYDITPGLRSF